jgi:cobalt-zinc-cadmium resistance protein CzcA
MRFNELLAGVRGDIAVKVFGDEFEPMLKAAHEVAAALRAVRGATDVKVEQAGGLPVLEIKVDKSAIARRGLSVSAVQEVIGAAVGGREAGVVFEGDRSFDIVVRLPESVRSDLEALGNLPVALPRATPSSPVQSLALNRVARFSFTEGPNQISRENGKRRIVVSVNVRGRDLGSVVEEAQTRVKQGVRLPPSYWMTWGGQSENLAAARQKLAIVVPACFAMIFLLLLAAMGSARDALLVFSAVPLAVTGGIFALWLRGMPFSISAAVGFIALSGVAVLNGLVMLSYIRQLRQSGAPLAVAIENGALTRFRPVVMTALVAALGFVPMAFATGTGAEVQKPLATVVIGGLISATLLTLAILPALYARYGRAAGQPSSRATPAISPQPSP